MHRIVPDVEAGDISAEFTRRGVSASVRVHALIEVPDDDALSTVDIAVSGHGLDWLNDEPELYSDADLIEPVR